MKMRLEFLISESTAIAGASGSGVWMTILLPEALSEYVDKLALQMVPPVLSKKYQSWYRTI
ncbi:MAG: hypothetical protein FVQ79_08395 [Planctomycetes bacterium]|nr:hypothetical protein [Planctomycetota bacterium]